MTTIAPHRRAPIRHPPRHRRHSRHQRRGHAVSLLAHLRSSRRGHQHAIRISARAQCRPQRPERHRAAHRLHLHPRAPHQGAPRRHDHRLRLLHAVSGQLHRCITRCTATSATRPTRPCASVYLPLLASHIILAVVALPLVLVTFFFSLTRPHSAAPQDRPLDLSAVALRLRHRRHHLRDAAPGARIESPCPHGLAQPILSHNPAMPDDGTRQLLQWGGSMVGTGLLAAIAAGDLAGRLFAAPAPAPTPAGSRSSSP